jgi:hypothetical protein
VIFKRQGIRRQRCCSLLGWNAQVLNVCSLSGDPQTVIDAGISVTGGTVAENEVKPGTREGHVAEWPNWEPTERL